MNKQIINKKIITVAVLTILYIAMVIGPIQYSHALTKDQRNLAGWQSAYDIAEYGHPLSYFMEHPASKLLQGHSTDYKKGFEEVLARNNIIIVNDIPIKHYSDVGLNFTMESKNMTNLVPSDPYDPCPALVNINNCYKYYKQLTTEELIALNNEQQVRFPNPEHENEDGD